MKISLDTKDGIEISSVEEFMREVKALNANKNNPSAQLFFRGQAVEYWDVVPSIFRNRLLSIEHSLMSEPLRQVPSEFVHLGGSFEIMEKYQHYGMSTRLLDVTTNPLVALYFACEYFDKEEYQDIETKEIEERYPQGIVLFKEEPMALKYNDFNVKVISGIASYDMTIGVTLEEIINNLYEDEIITEKQRRAWLDDRGIYGFINICQGTYTVLPVLNNERLIRQSGAFILPGKFNITARGNRMQDALITKAECDLREEFEKEFFYISGENKSTIREELEHISINEASLFPELEYQLRHIRKQNELNRRAVAYYEAFQRTENRQTELKENSSAIDILDVEKIINKYVSGTVSSDVIDIFKKNQVVDWQKRDSAISRIKILTIKKLLENDYEKEDAEKVSAKILKEIIG